MSDRGGGEWQATSSRALQNCELATKCEIETAQSDWNCEEGEEGAHNRRQQEDKPKEEEDRGTRQNLFLLSGE